MNLASDLFINFCASYRLFVDKRKELLRSILTAKDNTGRVRFTDDIDEAANGYTKSLKRCPLQCYQREF